MVGDNDTFMHSTYNEGKSVVAERFIRTLKGQRYKKMTVMIINFILATRIN